MKAILLCTLLLLAIGVLLRWAPWSGDNDTES